MKRSIINFLEKNSKGKVNNLKRKYTIGKMVDNDFNDMDYNPKTARYKSLKGLGLKIN